MRKQTISRERRWFGKLPIARQYLSRAYCFTARHTHNDMELKKGRQYYIVLEFARSFNKVNGEIGRPFSRAQFAARPELVKIELKHINHAFDTAEVERIFYALPIGDTRLNKELMYNTYPSPPANRPQCCHYNTYPSPPANRPRCCHTPADTAQEYGDFIKIGHIEHLALKQNYLENINDLTPGMRRAFDVAIGITVPNTFQGPRGWRPRLGGGLGLDEAVCYFRAQNAHLWVATYSPKTLQNEPLEVVRQQFYRWYTDGQRTRILGNTAGYVSTTTNAIREMARAWHEKWLARGMITGLEIASAWHETTDDVSDDDNDEYNNDNGDEDPLLKYKGDTASEAGSDDSDDLMASGIWPQ
jgi:hypothetical protein